MSEKDNSTEALSSLYPGTVIDLEDERFGRCTVYPMGFIHVQKFSKDITFAVSALSKVAIPPGATEQQKATTIMAQMIPYVVNNLLELVEDCIKFDRKGLTLSQLAHWEVPPLIEAWINESFGSEKKWKPWILATEAILNQILKPEKPIRILEMLSKSLSAQDTTSTKSSTAKTTTSPTPGGV